MALIECQECHGKLSSKASACPHCGAPSSVAAGPPSAKPKPKSRPVLLGCCGASAMVVLAFFVLSIVAVMLGDESVRTTRDMTAEGSVPRNRSEPSESGPSVEVVPPVRVDVQLEVLADDRRPPAKRSLEIRLSHKVSEEELRAIAAQLKNADQTEYDRTFIAYLLPGMERGAGAWATSHYDPDLNVRILGLSADQEAALTAEPDARDIVGKWVDEGIAGGVITIFKDGGTLFLEQRLGDGSAWTEELVETESGAGRRFDPSGGSATGDHFVVDTTGNLQIRDHEGLIKTAKKVD